MQYQGELMYVELRPHLRAFLSALSSVCEVAIYTAGRQPYADLILGVIDPDR